MKEISKMFGGENAEMYNALYTALELCAKDDDNRDIYTFLEDTPKTTLITLLVNKLLELGFKITES